MLNNLEQVNLVRKNDGIYYSMGQSQISYPEAGNAECFEVEEDSFWFRHRNRVITTVVQRYGVGEAFYDIGGGNGFVSKGLQDAGVPVVLLEPGPIGARNAKQRGVEKVICGTFQEINFSPGSMPSAGVFDVVEHIEEDINFMVSLHEAISDKGKLFITVPAFQNLWSYHDVEAGHYRRYTLHSLSELCKQAGFYPVYSTYFFSPLVPPIFLQRTVPTLLGLGNDKERAKTAERKQKQLREKKGFVGSILNKVLEWEHGRLSSGETIRLGSSIMMVCEKINN